MFRLSISATAQRRLLPLPSQGAPAPGPIRPHGRGLRPAAAALLAACAMAAAAQPAPSTTPTRPAPPALRIVTLQPSLTETVCMLGGCDRLVGIDRYSDWPAAALQHLPRVGGLADANVEAIVALRPDLVLLNPRSRAAERLRALGLRVLPLEARTHADIRRNLETVALALGRPGAGEALWQTLNARLDATRARIPPEWLHRRVYLEMHGGQAAGESSFIGETLARLGLRSIAPAQMGAFPRLTPEYVLRANPDLLVTSQASPVPPPAKRPGWHTLPAVRLQRHCHMAAHQFSVLLRPGPRLDEAAERVLACLHT
ncbi:MAG: helical backbone metal receptor, partial [Comamonadaceae bacterium]|nr:helical backbone metal receptor [Comamonadaceae bacterium]